MIALKPIFQYDREGGLELAGRTTFGKSVHDALIEKCVRLGSEMDKPRVAIAHLVSPDLANRYAEAFAKRFSPIEILIAPMSPVIGVHGGRNCIGVALLDEAAP